MVRLLVAAVAALLTCVSASDLRVATVYTLPDRAARGHGSEGEQRPGVKLEFDRADWAAGAAVGRYSPESRQRSGWGLLWVNGTRNVPPTDAAYAMGYAEGALTHREIHHNWINMLKDWFGGHATKLPDRIASWLEANLKWSPKPLPTLSHPLPPSPTLSHPLPPSPTLSHPPPPSPTLSHPPPPSPTLSHPLPPSPTLSHPLPPSPTLSHPLPPSPTLPHPLPPSPTLSHPLPPSPTLSHPLPPSPTLSHPLPILSHPLPPSPTLSHPLPPSPNPLPPSPTLSHPLPPSPRTREESQKPHNSGPFWGAVRMLLAQLDGLVAGYTAHCPAEARLGYLDLLALTADGDLETIIPMVNNEVYPLDAATQKGLLLLAPLRNRPRRLRRNHFEENFHCSALIRLLPDNADILFGHTTWDHYTMMVRSLKAYHYPMPDGDVALSFSSSPGFITSVDDFFLTSHGLAVFETTNGNFNVTLQREGVRPGSVLSWLRSMAANLLARSGRQWIDHFSQHNSGTYNNQWMLLDLKLFEPRKPLKPRTFWILEQLPDLIEYEDMTQHLAAEGFWGSYNVPYFLNVYRMSGFHKYHLMPNGEEYSYFHCSRARIFAREHRKVRDMASYKRLLRYNRFETDPLSEGDGCNAVSARCDLNTNPKTFALDGGIDAKATSTAMARRLQFFAQMGPTHDNQRPFEWTAEYSNYSHVGQPTKFHFDWVLFKSAPDGEFS